MCRAFGSPGLQPGARPGAGHADDRPLPRHPPQLAESPGQVVPREVLEHLACQGAVEGACLERKVADVGNDVRPEFAVEIDRHDLEPTEAQDRTHGSVPDPDLDDPAAESRRLLELVPVALEPFERVVAALVEGGRNLDKRFEPRCRLRLQLRRSESFAVMPLPRRRVLPRLAVAKS